MKKLLAISLFVGFLLVDSLFFHDFFKSGEVTTVPQYLTGLLSIPVMLISLRELLRTGKHFSSS
jgi:hypothetical protein